MEEYLSYYGWHFSKKMCQWASSKMYRKEGGQNNYITPYIKEDVDSILAKYGVTLDSDNGYDAVYVANMCKADFLGRSVRDEQSLALYVKDVVDDPDAYEGMIFTRFYADCIGSGTVIDWEDML